MPRAHNNPADRHTAVLRFLHAAIIHSRALRVLPRSAWAVYLEELKEELEKMHSKCTTPDYIKPGVDIISKAWAENANVVGRVLCSCTRSRNYFLESEWIIFKSRDVRVPINPHDRVWFNVLRNRCPIAVARARWSHCVCHAKKSYEARPPWRF